MCTVTFIPIANSVFLTSNRDESPSRRASGLTSFHAPDKNVIHYPLDADSGGTWIAYSDSGRIVCLLNGAFEPFKPDPPYRQSRGQVVIEAASEPEIDLFLQEYSFHRIAPFTLLIYEQDRFKQLTWDGENKHLKFLSAKEPQIWSSVTLYSPEVRAWRKSLFEKWLAGKTNFDREEIMQFHQMTHGLPGNDFVMNRNEVVKTLSITSIVLNEKSGSLLHVELDTNVREEIFVRYD
ncbi:MAG: NRDE family protein [Saprospiraceae bacterium]